MLSLCLEHTTLSFSPAEIPAHPSVCTLLGVATFLESLPSFPRQKNQVLAWLTAHPCPGDPALGSLMGSPLRAGSRPPLSTLPDSSSAEHSQTRFLEVHVLPDWRWRKQTHKRASEACDSLSLVSSDLHNHPGKSLLSQKRRWIWECDKDSLKFPQSWGRAWVSVCQSCARHTTPRCSFVQGQLNFGSSTALALNYLWWLV